LKHSGGGREGERGEGVGAGLLLVISGPSARGEKKRPKKKKGEGRAEVFVEGKKDGKGSCRCFSERGRHPALKGEKGGGGGKKRCLRVKKKKKRSGEQARSDSGGEGGGNKRKKQGGLKSVMASKELRGKKKRRETALPLKGGEGEGGV